LNSKQFSEAYKRDFRVAGMLATALEVRTGTGTQLEVLTKEKEELLSANAFGSVNPVNRLHLKSLF
jgi:hypothetical protein